MFSKDFEKRRANGGFLRGCVGVRGDGFKVWLDGDVWGLVELWTHLVF